MSQQRIIGLTKQQQEIIFGKTKESRKPILANVRTKVYKRAKGCCESCGEKTPKSLGAFHHWRTSNISPTDKTVQFLCLKCHKKYGHKTKVVVHSDLIKGNRKETKIIRFKVKKHPKKKKTKIKKKAIKKKRKTKKKIIKKTKSKKSKTKWKKKISNNFLEIKLPEIKLPNYKL